MKFNIKAVSVVATAILSTSSFAAQENLTGSFTTIVAVAINPTATELEINGLQIGVNDTCTLDAGDNSTATTYLGDLTMRLENPNTGPNAAGTAVNTTTTGSSGCVLSTSAGGNFGLYEISGAPGTDVNVTVVASSGGDISLVPKGCVGNYVDGGDDTCDAITTSVTPTTIRLADTTGGALGEGQPIAGTSLIALGGTVTVLNALTPGTPYPVDFQINVTY